MREQNAFSLTKIIRSQGGGESVADKEQSTAKIHLNVHPNLYNHVWSVISTHMVVCSCMLSFPLVSFAFPDGRSPGSDSLPLKTPANQRESRSLSASSIQLLLRGKPPSPSMEGQAPTLQPSPSRKKSKTAKLAKLNPMKWFKRKKSRSFEPIEVSRERSSLAPHGTPPVSSRLLAQLPGALLERIFSFVCPHTQDETYESCEQSAVEDTCMLCDLRDLAHCAQVSRQWRFHATNLL